MNFKVANLLIFTFLSLNLINTEIFAAAKIKSEETDDSDKHASGNKIDIGKAIKARNIIDSNKFYDVYNLESFQPGQTADGTTAKVEDINLGIKYEEPDELSNLLEPKESREKASNKSIDKQLILAVRAERADDVKRLIEFGADVNFHDIKLGTAINAAILNKNEEIVKLLIDAGLNVNGLDHKGIPYFSTVLRCGNKNIVKLFIDAGVTIERSILQNGVMFGMGSIPIEIIELLINKCDSIVHWDQGFFRNTPLIVSTIANTTPSRRIAIVKLLIKSGAKVNAVNKYGRTALMYAAKKGMENLVSLLIDAGADINIIDNFGNTAVTIAGRNGHMKIFELLLHSGAKDTKEMPDAANYTIEIPDAAIYKTVNNDNIDDDYNFSVYSENSDDETDDKFKNRIEKNQKIIKLALLEPERRASKIRQCQNIIQDKILEVSNMRLPKDIAAVISQYIINSYGDVLSFEKDNKNVVSKSINIIELLLKSNADYKNKRKATEDLDCNEPNKKPNMSVEAIAKLILMLSNKKEQVSKDIVILQNSSDADKFNKIEQAEEEIEEIEREHKLLLDKLKDTKE